MAPRLQVLNGKRQGVTFDLGRGDHIVGHRQTAHISIDDPWVSWDHARVFVQGEGYWIEDLGSTNGTYVNCVRVKRERLNHEDIIFFGKTHVIFLIQEGASSRGSSVGSGDGFASSPPAPRGSSSGRAMDPAAALEGRSPSGSTGPAIPVPAAEAAPLALPRAASRSRALADETPTWEAPQQSPPPRPSPRPGDPFASALAGAPRGGRDPLLDDARDPFSIGSSDGSDLLTRPEARERSFADTHHDEEERGTVPGRSGVEALEDFAIDPVDDEEGVGEASGVDQAPSAAEVSRLLGNRTADDLDALLGDAAAMTPDPSVARVPPGVRKRGGAMSEARTRDNLDALAIQKAIDEGIPPAKPRAEPSAITGRLPAAAPAAGASPPTGSARFGPGAQAAPAPSGTGRFSKEAQLPGKLVPLPPAPGTSRIAATPSTVARVQPGQAPAPSAVGPRTTTKLPQFAPPSIEPAAAAPGSSADAGMPDPGKNAFETARLDDEVRRLRAALKAAAERSPEAVRIAAETLRDQELGRLARRVAELEGELARRTAEVDHKQKDLDAVTEDMIAKEDLIDALRGRLRTAGLDASGAKAAPAAKPAPRAVDPQEEPPRGMSQSGDGDSLEPSQDELRALEF